MRTSPVLPVIAGDSKFQPVYVQDVAAAALAALVCPDAAGRTFELGGPDIMSFRAILAMINTETRLRRQLVEVPAGMAALLGKLGDLLPFMPMTTDQLAMLQKDNVANPALPGLADLGITPTPMAAFVPAMLERYRPGGRFSKAA
jgi:NADH dehydrogenase